MAYTYQEVTKRFDISVSQRKVGQIAELGPSFAMDVSYGDKESPLRLQRLGTVIGHSDEGE